MLVVEHVLDYTVECRHITASDQGLMDSWSTRERKTFYKCLIRDRDGTGIKTTGTKMGSLHHHTFYLPSLYLSSHDVATLKQTVLFRLWLHAQAHDQLARGRRKNTTRSDAVHPGVSLRYN